jgi:activator of HSP90 ATPase
VAQPRRPCRNDRHQDRKYLRRGWSTFTVWDGFISGTNLELEPHKRIVQSWRTAKFSHADPDSEIEVTLVGEVDGTRVTIRHTDVPDGHTSYRDGGWQENYFDPMKVYFAQWK